MKTKNVVNLRDELSLSISPVFELVETHFGKQMKRRMRIRRKSLVI